MLLPICTAGDMMNKRKNACTIATVRSAKWLMEPYGYGICLMVGSSCLDVLNSVEYEQYTGAKPSPDILTGRGKSIGLFIAGGKTRGVLIFPLKGLTYSTVAHEILHLVTEVLLSRGIKFSRDSEEVWAYHLGHVLDQALEQLRYWKVPMHNWHLPLTDNKPKA